jgi:hypothetical protein
MPNEYADNYEEDTQEDAKGLRAQLKKVLADNKAKEERITELEGFKKQTTVNSVLAAKGVNPKVAKFIPSDVLEEEEVAKWLDDNADVFGFVVGEQGTPEAKPAVSQEAIQSNNRLQNLSASAQTPNVIQDYEARIKNASSQSEVAEILDEARRNLL